MRIGVPKEIKNHEYRVGLPPAGVVELVNHGHEVAIETTAGEGAGFSNEDYVAAGASIVDAPETIFDSFARGSYFSLTCTWLPIVNKPICSWKAGQPALPTRRSRVQTAVYHC
jgi:hypothetical protein